MLDLEPPPAFHLPPPPPPPWLEEQQELGQCGTCPGQEEASGAQGDTFHTSMVILVLVTSMIVILLTLASLLHTRLRKLARKSREVAAGEADYQIEDMPKLERPQLRLNHYTNLPSEARLVYQYQYQHQYQHHHQHQAPVYSDTSLTLSLASSASASASWGQDRRTQSPLEASPDIPVTEL